MRITKLNDQEMEDQKLSDEELERQMLQRAIEKYKLNEQMDISPVVGEERDEFLPEIDYEKLPKDEYENLPEANYDELPKDKEELERFLKLKQLLSK